MQFSFIIPIKNEAAIVSQSLDPLQWLRTAGHEIVLVDGGSEDASCDIARPLVDVLLVSESGRARQMNAGANAAKGDVLIFLHIDTVFSQQALHDLQTAINDSTSAWGRFDVSLSGQNLIFRVIESMMNIRSRLTGIATGDQGMFLTKGLFEQVGGFPDLPLMEDIEMSKCLKQYGRPICLKTRIITSSRRWENKGIIQTVLLMWKLRLFYWLGVDSLQLAKQYYR